ncbi:hypothetical protein [Cellvibrio sp. UBA7671]|uniref:hypothetical protein n=1 Tax=Cellvibrio sp. UBA7671 TaxID=1946312 RepID=UPI002F357C09
MSDLTKQELEAIAAAGAEKGITNVLEKLGIDPADFLEVQADQAHLRKQRKAFEQVTTITTRVVLTTLIGGFLAAVWMGFKEFLHK